MENLQGKTAFITGGASGLGLGIAKACAKEGMNIVIADLRQDAIDEALVIFKENNWPAIGVCLNVADREAYVAAADAAEAAFGKIHVLVNNAGLGVPEGKIWDDSWDIIDLAVDVNYKGVLNGMKIIIPRIIAHGEGGHVVSTASKAALVPVPGFTLYNSLKMAVVTVMETLATDLRGTNIGSSVFCPGPFVTNLGASTGTVMKSMGVEVKRPEPPKAPEKKDDAPPPPPPKMDIDFSKIMRSPDEAGARVVRGIKRNDIYIFSHSDFKAGWVARAEAIAKGFPDEPVNPDFNKVFSVLAYNPTFERQTQVPAWEAE